MIDPGNADQASFFVKSGEMIVTVVGSVIMGENRTCTQCFQMPATSFFSPSIVNIFVKLVALLKDNFMKGWKHFFLLFEHQSLKESVQQFCIRKLRKKTFSPGTAWDPWKLAGLWHKHQKFVARGVVKVVFQRPWHHWSYQSSASASALTFLCPV